MASYGPAMPPDQSKRKSSQVDEDDDDDEIGPALPPHLLRQTGADSSDDDGIGPALPPHLQQKTTPKEVTKDEEKEEEFGVPLPPDYSRWNTFDVDASDDDFGENDDDERDTKETAVDAGLDKLNDDKEEDDDDSYGPALPPGFTKPQSTDNVETTSDSNVRNYGPSLPPGSHSNRMPVALPADEESDDDEEDEMIGPMPLKPGSEGLYSMSTAEEFEKRSTAMKEKIAAEGRPQQPVRETWMMELPGYSTNFGLGSRTFRKTPRPEEKDRSEWTDTPADKAQREKERAEKRRSEERAGKSKKEKGGKELSQRDKKLTDMVAKHNEAKRADTLVDMHTKDRKRKLEEEGEQPVERRPFDRDLDLNVNQFDEAKRKLLIKKSAQLNTKFSHGTDKVYL